MPTDLTAAEYVKELHTNAVCLQSIAAEKKV